MPEFRINPAPLDPDEDEIQVAPAETESAAERLARLEHAELVRRMAQRDSSPGRGPRRGSRKHTFGMGTPLRFSLQELLLAFTAVAIWLGALRLLVAFNRSALVIALGLLALAGMYKWSRDDQASGTLRLVWWGMLLGYLSMVAVSIW